MNVISLFDGISCAYVALQKAGISIKSYTAYEIDKYAISTSKKNHPSIQHKGDVKTLVTTVPCDLLVGGSPCLDLSISKRDRMGLRGTYSSLFWEYARIKRLLSPTYFVLENVASMTDEDRDTISAELGVQPIMFDAGLVSAQRRKRYFWTNIPFTIPAQRGISVRDILMGDVDEKYYLNMTETEINERKRYQAYRLYPIEGKSMTLTANGGGAGAKTGLYKINERIRRLTPIECERLQGLPDNYTQGLSDTQRYKCCGNAFNADVMAHILSPLRLAAA
jgi:site-specific DNA-cytosine methylase